MKICTKCKENKSLEEYSICIFPNGKKGYRSQCKTCISTYGKKRNLSRKEENRNYYLNNRDRDKINQKLYYLNNKEEYNKKSIIYRKNNREIFQKATKKWIENNPDYHKEYRKKRYNEDPNFKLRILLGCRLNELFRKKKINKNNKTGQLLGCGYYEAKLHIESLFTPEMSWENHGEIWEIDHIIPCSKFDLTLLEEQQKCFHYTNLQPLFKTTKIAESFGYTDQIGNRNKLGKIL